MVDGKKPFVFNSVINKNRIAERDKLVALNRLIREKMDNVSKCVMYTTDKDAAEITAVPLQQQREYAVITVFDKNESPNPNKFDMNVKIAQGTLSLNKYRVIASKKFNTSNGPICKMVVKLM